MASKHYEFKVGLLVLAGIAILILALWLAKGYRYGQKNISVSVLFPEVGALSVGDPVAVSGVTKGKVRKITLVEGKVRVDMDLAADIILREDASFAIKNIGLMGERFVAVRPGISPKPLDLLPAASGSIDPGIPEVMGMMGEVIDRMNNITRVLEQTAVSPSTLDKFTETITNLQEITKRMAAATGRNFPKIDGAVDDVAELAHRLKEGVERNQGHVDNAARVFDSVSGRFLAMVDDLEIASARLRSFAEELDQSEGSLRMFLDDRRLYDDLRSTAHNIDSLVNDIRDHPRKYINLSVEIF